MAALPAIAIAYVTFGAPTAGAVILFYIVVQQLENHLIVPKIMKENVDVSPLATILLILIGFTLDNVLGALLAVPIYIFCRTVYGFWMRQRSTSSQA
jgi:predicted PurR-regulated permease PerM